MSGRIPKRVKIARLKNNSNQIGLNMQGNGNTVGNRPMINNMINISGRDRKEFSLKVHGLSIIFKLTIMSVEHLA